MLTNDLVQGQRMRSTTRLGAAGEEGDLSLDLCRIEVPAEEQKPEVKTDKRGRR